ncbi:MAG: S-layer protein [Firmicutes bacterium]|nr:S-layer protein [Bacillota bacterium]
MKRSLVGILALLLAFGVAGIALAASDPASLPISNSFVDVPANHWAYNAVATLCKDGIITGYNERTFKGDRPITRYEMAKIVVQALGKEGQANDEEAALIDKLAAEFAQELAALNVRVSQEEQKVDKFNINAFVVFKYDYQSDCTWPGNGTVHMIQGGFKFTTFTTYRVDQNWSANLVSSYTRDTQATMGVSGDAVGGTTYNYPGMVPGNHDETMNMYISGKVSDVGVVAGRFHYADAAYGWVYNDDCTNGLQFSFGKVAKANAVIGYLDLGSNLTGMRTADALFATNVPKYRAVDITVPISPATNLVGAYHDIISTTSGVASRQIYAIGGDTQLTKDIWMNTVYSKSDDSTQNKGFLIGLRYGKQDWFKRGSWEANIRWSYCDVNAFISTGPWMQQESYNGARGWDFSYVVTPNIRQMYSIEYVIMKATVPTSSWKDNFLRVMWNFMLF